MKRRTIFLAFLFSIGANFSLAQSPPPRDLTQIRNETLRRNRAVENPNNNPFNRNAPTLGTGRFLNTGRIPGSEIRKYVLAAQVETKVTILKVGSGDTLLVNDGVNKVVIRIIGIDTPEEKQPVYEESKKSLSDLVSGKKIVLRYSLHNLKDELGYFPARVFGGGRDVGLELLKNGYAWRNEKDKFFLEKKDDKEYAKSELQAQVAKIGIWQSEKPQKPRDFREKLAKEKKKAAKD